MDKMPWRILVVDDDQDVHDVTRIALRQRTWKGQRFDVHSVHSAAEARECLRHHSFDVALIDVVMETDNAGLELCRFARSLFPTSPRIVLRTGQPGAAPEDEILENFDIDYYLAKSEATSQNLFRVIRSCLRTLEDYVALEEANTALTIANSELSRQATFRERVLARLGNGTTGYVAQIADHARRITSVAPQDVERLANNLGQVAQRMMEIFAPLDFRGHAETTLANKRVLILLKDQKALKLTQGALAGTAGRPVATANWPDALESLRTGNIDILYVDWDNRGILEQAVKFNPNVIAILLTRQAEFEQEGQRMLELSAASAVVVSPLADADRGDQALWVQELVVTAGKLMSGEIFGLEKYLSWGVSVHEETLTRTDQRTEAVDRVLEFAKQCRLRPSVRRRLATFVDELLMNAMWDAPVDAYGNPKYIALPRNQPVALLPEEAVTLRYASDGNHFAVSATDNFGRLEREVAFRYVVHCMAKEGRPGGEDEDRAPQAPAEDGEPSAGAGLGLYMAYLSMSSFVVNVLPGQKTEVIGFLDMQSTPRDVNLRPRRFHYFCAKAPRREHPRMSLESRVTVRLPDGSEVVPGCIRNISLGGLFVALPTPPAVGCQLRLEIGLDPLDPAKVLTCTGRVVWSTGVAEELGPEMRGVGIQFEGVSDIDLHRIAELIAAQPDIPKG